MKAEALLAQLLEKHGRVAIAGGPRTGKTTLAGRVTCRDVVHTDDFIGCAWEEVPHKVIEAVAGKERFLVEGVMVPRALRKGLEVDAVLWLDEAMAAQSPKQEAMARGVRTVFNDWLANSRRGSEVIATVKRAA